MFWPGSGACGVSELWERPLQVTWHMDFLAILNLILSRLSSLYTYSINIIYIYMYNAFSKKSFPQLPLAFLHQTIGWCVKKTFSKHATLPQLALAFLWALNNKKPFRDQKVLWQLLPKGPAPFAPAPLLWLRRGLSWGSRPQKRICLRRLGLQLRAFGGWFWVGSLFLCFFLKAPKEKNSFMKKEYCLKVFRGPIQVQKK